MIPISPQINFDVHTEEFPARYFVLTEISYL